MRKAIIHVGPPKTGTTTIQTALNMRRPELAASGVFFPPVGQEALPWEILESLDIPVVRITESQLTWTGVLAEFEGSRCDTLLLSAEDFALEQFRQSAAMRLSEILADFDVRIVFGLRDPLAVMRSVWRHSVRWNAGGGEQTQPFDTAIQTMAALDRIRVIPYLELLEAYLSRDVRLFTVPRRPNNDVLLRRFASAAGLPKGVHDILAKTELGELAENASLSYRHTLLLLRLNQILMDNGISVENGERFDLIEARSLVLSTIAGGKSDRITSSAQAFAVASTRRANLIAWVANRPIVGDLSDLQSTDEAEANELPLVSDVDVILFLLETISKASAQTVELRAYMAELIKARDFWCEKANQATFRDGDPRDFPPVPPR